MRRQICLLIVAGCESQLDAFPTSIIQDEQLIQQSSFENDDMPHQAAAQPPCCSQADAKHMQAEHKQLAVHYRLTRKRTLKAVKADIESQATLLSAQQELGG